MTMKTTSGYRLVLPPGWAQVPVRDSGPGTAHKVISAAGGGKPGELRALDGAPASRVERVAAARGDDDPSGEYAATLACLFDAIMSTLRWT